MASPLALSKHALKSNAMLRALVPVLIVAAASPFAYGHALHLFASVSGDHIEGKAYYSDSPAAGIPVTIVGPDDEILATVRSDVSGTFTWHPTKRCDLRFVAESEDGHRTEFTIAAEELPRSRSAPEPEPSVIEVAAEDGPDDSDRSSPSSADLERLVAEAVSREVAPLREQLDAATHRTQLRDIVGGLGYIAGVAGLFALWKRRTSRSDR
ncbi:MAG: hypothetical protein KJ060_09460 [Candidatus Hydrogenedentes bacterium]|nr:hypothetical protein [Candidatus Hydrogenedentota bacterium]